MQDAAIERAAIISRNERYAQWQFDGPSERDRINAERLASWQPPTPSQRGASSVVPPSRPPTPLMASFQRPEQWLEAMFAGCPSQGAAHSNGQHPQPRQARSATCPEWVKAKVAKSADPGSSEKASCAGNRQFGIKMNPSTLQPSESGVAESRTVRLARRFGRFAPFAVADDTYTPSQKEVAEEGGIQVI